MSALPPFASPEERLARLPTLLVEGRLEEAARLCSGVLETSPGHPTAEYFAGLIAYERGADAEALDAYRRVHLHSRDPRLRALAHHGLGLVHQRRDEILEAEEAFRKATSEAPDEPSHLRALAEVFLEQGRREDAVEVLRRTIRMDSSQPVHWGLLAQALADLGRYDEALEALETCESRLGPRTSRYAETVGLRARIALIQGDLEGARETYRRALERDPTYPGYTALAELTPISGTDDPFLADLEERQRTLNERVPVSVRADLAYALGHACEEARDPARAFAAYAEGARLRRSPRASEIVTRHLERLALLRERFGRTFFEAVAARVPNTSSPPGFVPLFLVGLPRGGSTLLEQILAAHPQVAAGGELAYGFRLARALLASWYAQGTFPPEDVEEAARALGTLAARYTEATRALRAERPVFVDKSLANFEHVGILAAAFPRAVFLHTFKEDALDQCWGIFRRSFHGHEYSYDLTDLGRTWRAYRALMDHWRGILPAGRLLDVPYERLVADPEGTIRTILTALDLPFDPACLHPEAVRRPVPTMSAAQVRRPLSAERVGSSAPFRPWLEPLRRALEGEGERSAVPTS